MSIAETGMTEPWLICVDTGGTFTDCLAVDPRGGWHRTKVLSTATLRGTVTGSSGDTEVAIANSWNAPPLFGDGFTFHLLDSSHFSTRILHHEPEAGLIHLQDGLPHDILVPTPFELHTPYEAPILAAHLVTKTSSIATLPPHTLRLATTRGTNALLTRTGTSPALFLTAGHADLLFIGTQQRPDLFALDIRRPEPLCATVCEVPERLNADGSVLRPLDENTVRIAAQQCLDQGIATAAVCLLHSYQNPLHEQRVASLLREMGFRHVSLASELAPFVKALPRAQTAVVNAYLAPIMEGYVARVSDRAGTATAGVPPLAPPLHLMTSAGGLVSAPAFRPKDSLLSGPAGGIVGAATAGRLAGFERLIAFDMGGTSTDVARFEGEYEYTFEHTVGDAHLVSPALAIESVAAGGGSLCIADKYGLRVGPESAGASPGPACYGAGGPLTITDVNFLLGYIVPDRFEIPLSRSAAEEALFSLLANLEKVTGTAPDCDTVLHTLRHIANERMADAIRKISVRKGYDPAEYALLSFGGAGGQHACAVAEQLGIRTIIIPPDASLLSAFGLAHATMERIAERQVLRSLGENGITDRELDSLRNELAMEALQALRSDGVTNPSVHRFIVRLRLLGQESTLDIEPNGIISLTDRFASQYRNVYGHDPANKPIEVESVRVIAREEVGGWSGGQVGGSLGTESGAGYWVLGVEQSDIPGSKTDQKRENVPIWERSQLRPDRPVSGPTLIVEQHSAIVVEAGWTCCVHSVSGALLMERIPTSSHTPPLAPPLGKGRGSGGVEPNYPTTKLPNNPFMVELFTARFAAIAEEMGEMLRRTALSTNVKERLDFSCAVLDADGALIATAAHIPVHLGALGVCVRRIRESLVLAPGDVIVTNHPAFGGSHLPDVTVITPVFDDNQALVGYVANRAHHAEIGGTRPGSMPPDAKSLAEEGVVVPPFYLMHSGESRLDELCRLLTDAPFPTRSVADNRADLEAALAANHRGATALSTLARTVGTERVAESMQAIIAQSERLVRAAFVSLPDGVVSATETLDDGWSISVCLTIAGENATVDFTGTGGVHPGNRNAPPAVTVSAVLYVLRLLIGEPIPLNEGLLRPITLILPPDSLVNPTFDPLDATKSPAVVGGNVETSQRIVDTLLKALGLCAASQGTMNNTLWGADTFGYYETVCGGSGATANAPGASCIHTHMTNTRITDVEVIERRYPVRIEQFARRHGSGGRGKHPGGDGVIRETVFLAPMVLSLLTERRKTGPYGIAGGQDGLPGKQTLIRSQGTIVELGSTDGAEVGPGDRLILETPGGGGWNH